jgi:hypothetical protein
LVRVIVWLVQFCFWLLVVRFLLRGLAGVIRSGGRRAAPERRGPGAAEELVRDPVCGAHFPRSHALPARLGGAEVLVCSEACRRRALEGRPAPAGS